MSELLEVLSGAPTTVARTPVRRPSVTALASIHARQRSTVPSPMGVRRRSVLAVAGLRLSCMKWVPVRTNPSMCDSRPQRSTFGGEWRNAPTVSPVFATYRPFRIFGAIWLVLTLGALSVLRQFQRRLLTHGLASEYPRFTVVGAMLRISLVLMFAIRMPVDLIGLARKIDHRAVVEAREIWAIGPARPRGGTKK